MWIGVVSILTNSYLTVTFAHDGNLGYGYSYPLQHNGNGPHQAFLGLDIRGLKSMASRLAVSTDCQC